MRHERHHAQQTGGTCSILTGVTFVVVVVLVLLSPTEQQVVCPCSGRFLTSLAHNSTLYIAGNGLLTLSLLLTIAVVLAVYETVRGVHDGWARWSSTLAIIGLAVNAIDAVRHAVLDPAKATAYVQGDASVQAALTVPGALEGLDPQGWLRLGAVGFWILLVSLLALRGGAWPKPLAYLGIVVALAVWLGLPVAALDASVATRRPVRPPSITTSRHSPRRLHSRTRRWTLHPVARPHSGRDSSVHKSPRCVPAPPAKPGQAVTPTHAARGSGTPRL